MPSPSSAPTGQGATRLSPPLSSTCERLRWACVLCAITWTACGAPPEDTPRAQTTAPTVIVYAAASLTDVLSVLSERFEAEHGVSVVPVVGPSSTLARQIELGARADVFLSADVNWTEHLVDRGLIEPEAVFSPIGNSLVAVGSADSPLELTSLEGLMDPAVTRIALADPSGVPAGRYARQALEGAERWDDLHARIIVAPDVRAAVAYVQRDEVEVAIVYATDAQVSDQVRILFQLPTTIQPEIRYGFAVVSNAPSPELAQRFAQYLGREEARQTFERYGFHWLGAASLPDLASGPAQAPPSSTDWQVVRLSVLVATAAVLFCLPFALCIGWLLARRDFFGKTIIENLVALPLVLPPAVTGFLLLVVLGRNGPVGRLLYEAFGIQISFTWLAAAIAAAVVSFPLVAQSIRLAIESIDPSLEQAARTLGASGWRVLATITLPLAMPGIIAGAVVGFARSLGELGATLVFAGNIPDQTQTIPLAVWSRVNQLGGEEAAMRLVVLSVVVSYLSLLAASRLHRAARRRVSGDDQ